MRKAIVTAMMAGLLGLSAPASAQAAGDTAGAFDYYVLALSWSPTWCALEGDARNSPQCDRPLGWVLHGLWPQYERGYPADCTSAARDPSKRETAAMSDIMGTTGAAWYQWKKHGRCSGLEGRDFLALSRLAYDSITRPAVFRSLPDDIKLPASVVEAAFLKDNPGLERNQITVTCKDRRIQEVRICLTRDLEPRKCGADVIYDCTLEDALMADID
ncbi:Ribonuclease T2 family protein [Aquimixticola soesokkakensis]|uniref:Ribonuclease T2 family protein n=1 Tax=Aquimixticola soesokkakensis TaxID=1519096 RepID=A0A1Y5SUS5_9RHOB|nr:ribonuclease T2 [Aquimixticola soesokkakensis]SLN49004.1 Ribonuclease T2 family protein [Aquimixticola soesokkakensis]